MLACSAMKTLQESCKYCVFVIFNFFLCMLRTVNVGHSDKCRQWPALGECQYSEKIARDNACVGCIYCMNNRTRKIFGYDGIYLNPCEPKILLWPDISRNSIFRSLAELTIFRTSRRSCLLLLWKITIQEQKLLFVEGKTSFMWEIVNFPNELEITLRKAF